jgi:hypothetical protein
MAQSWVRPAAEHGNVDDLRRLADQLIELTAE